MEDLIPDDKVILNNTPTSKIRRSLIPTPNGERLRSKQRLKQSTCEASTSQDERIVTSLIHRRGITYSQDSQSINPVEKYDPQNNSNVTTTKKSSERKQCKQVMKKHPNKHILIHEKKREYLPEPNASQNCIKTEQQFLDKVRSFPKISQANCKEHVIDEDDTDDPMKISDSARRIINAGDFSDLWNDNDNTTRNESQYVRILMEKINAMPNTDTYSILAPFRSTNSSVATDDDVRLFQILRFAKHYAGGINLLFNFIQRYCKFINKSEVTHYEDYDENSLGECSDFEDMQYITDEEVLTEDQQVNFGYESPYDTDNITKYSYVISDESNGINETDDQEEQYCSSDDSKTDSSLDTSTKLFKPFKNECKKVDPKEKDIDNSDTESDTNSSKSYVEGSQKIINYSEDQSSSSGDTNNEIEDNERVASESKYCYKVVSNCSDDSSEIVSSSALPYMNSTNSSTSSHSENYIFNGCDVAKNNSVGVQTNFETHYQCTSTTNKILNKKHRSHKCKKSYSNGIISHLTPKSKWRYKKFRNSTLKNRRNIFPKSYNTPASNYQGHTVENKNTEIKFRNKNILTAAENYKRLFFDKMEDLNDCSVLNTDINSKSDNELLDEEQCEIIGICNVSDILNESENGLLYLIEKAESELFGLSNEQEEPEKFKKESEYVSPQNCNAVNKGKDMSEFKENEMLQSHMDFTNQTLNIKTECEQNQEKTECFVWNVIKEIESPFKWAPDIMILEGNDNKLQQNIIQHLTVKEKEFLQAKKNVFREIIVHLVLSYEKVLADNLIEAMADIQHCFNLLDYEPTFAQATVDFPEIQEEKFK
ncbi:hypothetical protein L9F63_004289 [Diploptera punctata]|uniref:Uncharacterized protein n=1 Tax=Diploptera punctata TaxID=6984 RepID=A0AAD7ZH88_DIPPU|nr:hypothetical protein L9F63_004289 [Diploptera punctata]